MIKSFWGAKCYSNDKENDDLVEYHISRQMISSPQHSNYHWCDKKLLFIMSVTTLKVSLLINLQLCSI